MAKNKNMNLEKIKEVFEQEETNKNRLGLSLVTKAIFMEETLNELEKKVKKNGVVTSMCQGAYDIDRENPALKSYTSLIKNFNTIIKQINELLPTEQPKEDEFESFE